MAYISLMISSTLEMQVMLFGLESYTLQENQVLSERVLSKEQTTKCRRVAQS
jgi:hypothetical protein